MEKYPAFYTERKYVIPTGGNYFEGELDVFLALDFADVCQRKKRGVILLAADFT